jgi:hypothetical protein
MGGTAMNRLMVTDARGSAAASRRADAIVKVHQRENASSAGDRQLQDGAMELIAEWLSDLRRNYTAEPLVSDVLRSWWYSCP